MIPENSSNRLDTTPGSELRGGEQVPSPAPTHRGKKTAGLFSGGSLAVAWFGLCVAALLIVGYLPVFYLYATDYWLPGRLQGLYTLSPLVMLCSLILAWRSYRRLRVDGELFLSRPLGYLLVVASVVIKVHGELEGYTVLRGASLIPLLLGLAMIFLPAQSFRMFRFPILFLAFAIPLPAFLLDQLTQPLLSLNTGIVAWIIGVLNLDVTREGYSFWFSYPGAAEQFEIQMAEGCSGLRSLFSLLAVCTLYLHLRNIPFETKLKLLVASVPIAGLGNLGRVLLTILLTRYVGPEAGQFFFHQLSGILVFAATVLAVFWVESLLIRSRGKKI